ncbi:MAG: tRNA pseudouridine(38-40) synthase TruA [Clostridia bacterium]|nr:tRNA pseudouridine(38-40) synthase TruA [Clostridia bacterium]
MRIRLEVEYDGTRYSGWQRQKNGRSIQQMLEKSVGRVTGTESAVHGSGRTDAGVHALAQVAHFDTESELAPERFASALNYYLPDDIRVIRSEAAPPDFHSRFDALGKTYVYTYRNHPQRSALHRGLSAPLQGDIDLEAMRRGAEYLLGEHDFASFCANAEGKDTVREIRQIGIERREPYIQIVITGSGFLHHMVRIIVGTLAMVGRGEILPEEIGRILEAKDRREAGPTAPAAGLLLKKVYYPEPVFA